MLSLDVARYNMTCPPIVLESLWFESGGGVCNAPDSLGAFVSEAKSCSRCGLSYERVNDPVVSSGSVDAQVAVVGRSPFVDEDASGELGTSGWYRDMVEEVYLKPLGVSVDSTYFTNTVFCFPKGGRDLVEEDCDPCCEIFKAAEFSLLKLLKVVLLLGQNAARSVIDPGFAIWKHYGATISVRGVLYVPVFNPVTLVRNRYLEDLVRYQMGIIRGRVSFFRQGVLA